MEHGVFHVQTQAQLPGFRLTRQVSSVLAELPSRPQLSSLSKQQLTKLPWDNTSGFQRIKIPTTSTGIYLHILPRSNLDLTT